jgi:hypothetical protein
MGSRRPSVIWRKLSAAAKQHVDGQVPCAPRLQAAPLFRRLLARKLNWIVALECGAHLL